MKHTEFSIENDTANPIAIAIEPEGMIASIEPNTSVVVKDDYNESPVTIRLSEGSDARIILCVWPGDGNTTVEKDGKDLLDLM